MAGSESVPEIKRTSNRHAIVLGSETVLRVNHFMRRYAASFTAPALLAASLLLTACIPVPKFSGSDRIDIDEQIDLVDARNPGPTDLAPILFRGADFEMPLDGTLGSFVWGPLCAPPYADITLLNLRNSGLDRTIIFDDPFTLAAADQGIDVADRPDVPFERRDRLSRAEYYVGASIIGLEVELCRKDEGLFERRIVGSTGKAEIAVDWYVYSRLTRGVVMQKRTRGEARLRGAHNDPLIAVMRKAFHAAAKEFTRDPALLSILKQPRNAALSASYAPGMAEDAPMLLREESLAPLRLNEQPLLTGSFSDHAARVSGAVVTISFGVGGFGSGFVISPDGYVLTNHHIVGDAERVRVEFDRQRWAEGIVLRRDPVRDVALIRIGQIPAGGLSAIPLQPNRPGVGSRIYAIGSPLDDSLHGTVSSGIVARYRRFRDQPFDYLQGDISIYPGNSGGPLVDASGNAVAIAAAGFVEWPGNSTNLNLFIPIDEALKALNIVYGERLLSQRAD